MNDALPKLYIVRHGETAWSISGQHTGRSDIPLTPEGERQARDLSARLKGLKVVEVLTSPLQRARRTCELAGFGERARPEPDLAEWDYGAYEGRRTADIRAERPGWSLFEDGCPGGESLADVSARADRVVTRIRAVEGDVLVFSHSHLLRVVIARWILLPAVEARRLQLSTGSVSALGYDHALDEPVILKLNS